MRPWSPRTLAEGQTLRYHLPPLELWIQRTGEECRIGSLPASSEAQPGTIEDVAAFPAEIDLLRFAVPADMNRLSVRPMPPDRSLVVRPAESLSILAGHATELFVSVPLFWNVALGREVGAPVSLCEIPSVTLTKSWFGENTAGESCYALKTRALHALGEDAGELNRFYCHIRLRNGGSSTFLLERFCLQTPALALYAGADNKLWSSDVKVSLRGGGTPAVVTHSDRSPAGAPGSRLVSPARHKVSQKFVLRALDQIRSKI